MKGDGHKVGCTGKKVFETFRRAARVAKRMRQEHEEGTNVEPYHCRHCNGFHVGEARQHGRPRPQPA